MQWRVVGSNDKLVQDPKQQETGNSNIKAYYKKNNEEVFSLVIYVRLDTYIPTCYIDPIEESLFFRKLWDFYYMYFVSQRNENQYL